MARLFFGPNGSFALHGTWIVDDNPEALPTLRLEAVGADLFALSTGSIESDARTAQRLRRAGVRGAIVALSPCTASQEAMAVDAGCSEVWPAPRDPDELRARVRRVLDLHFRDRAEPADRLNIGNIALDRGECAIERRDGSDACRLTRTESDILALLADSGADGVGAVAFARLRQDAEDRFVRRPVAAPSGRSPLSVHLVRLRKKLAAIGADAVIRTVRGRAVLTTETDAAASLPKRLAGCRSHRTRKEKER